MTPPRDVPEIVDRGEMLALLNEALEIDPARAAVVKMRQGSSCLDSSTPRTRRW